MANILNNHFTSIGPKLSANIPETDASHPIIINDENMSFAFKGVTYEEVRKILCALSPSKSCGVDGLTTGLMKACGEAIIPPTLLHVFNISISKGKFPTIWKIARVTPLFKEGKTDDANNYRPISVLPILSKVFERVIHNRTYEYLSNTNLLNDCQSGFRKRHSTVTCLIEFLDAIYNSIKEGRLSGVHFFDLKKAFDMVNHNIAINKLSYLNMSPLVLKWFNSYVMVDIN